MDFSLLPPILLSLFQLCFNFCISFVNWFMASFLHYLPYSYCSSNCCDRKRAIKKEANNWYQKGSRVITLKGAIEKSLITIIFTFSYARRENSWRMKLFIFQYCDSNIGFFSIAPCKVITLNLLCILFGNSSLLLFWLLSL